jgi:hypothetical protein
MNKIKILFFIGFFLLTACSTEKDQPSNLKESNKQSSISPAEIKTAKIEQNSAKKIPDIMKPLAGTDPCFEYVELVRDSNDLETYRSFGDSILLKDDEPTRDEQRTYIGIIAAMLKKNSSVAEIRQAVLDACQELKNQDQLRKK